MGDLKKLRPGDAAPMSGLYAVVDADDTITEVIYRIKAKGLTLPPTFRKNQSYVRLDGGIKPGRKTA